MKLSGYPRTLARLTLSIVTTLGASTIAGCVATAPLKDTRFDSCQAAVAAVQAAGRDGLQFAHDRVYSDERCFFPGLEYVVLKAVREIGGQSCEVGYVCIEQGIGAGR